jgi:hypothetical protein
LTAQVITGPSTEQIFTGEGSVLAKKANWVSVAWWGAMVANADAAPAFRRALGNNRVVFVPLGRYVFRSTEATSNPLFANGAGVIVNSSNFKLSGYGATIENTKQPIGYSLFIFTGCKNFLVEGLQLNGTQEGDVTSIINYNGFSLFGVNGFSFSNIHFTGIWSAFNAAFDGDWIVNGTFEKIQMDNLGMGFDLAYVEHCKFDNILGYGRGQGAQCLGNIGFSIIHDESVYGNCLSFELRVGNLLQGEAGDPDQHGSAVCSAKLY